MAMQRRHLLAGVFDAPNPGLSLGLGDPGLG